MNNVEEVREIARSAFDDFCRILLPKTTPLNTLCSMDWADCCGDSFSQTDLAQMNLGLDLRSCLGRTALAVTIVEEFFPHAQVKCAEIARDMFRRIMLQQWGPIYNIHNPLPDSWLEELLMYEEPHSIVIVDGKQFDPLFCVYAQQANCPVEDLSHPGIIEFPAWEEITAARMVSEAWLDPNPNTKLETLRAAEQICPGTIIVRQNLVEPLVATGNEQDLDEAMGILHALCEESPSVRRLMVLEDFSGVTSHKHEYDADLWSLLVSYVRRQS